MHTINVGEEVTVFTVQALLSQWQAILDDTSHICLDCSQITEFDSCGAQLFYFVATTWGNDASYVIEFTHIPDDILDDLKTLNLQGIVTDDKTGEA